MHCFAYPVVKICLTKYIILANVLQDTARVEREGEREREREREREIRYYL